MVQIRELLSKLNSAAVEYVIVGGVAANLHGSPLYTQDLDVCCPMTEQNMTRLLQAIGSLHPTIRDPRKLPLTGDPKVLATYRMLLLATDLGHFDVLKDLDGIGDFEAVEQRSVIFQVSDNPTRVLSLDALIEAKKRAGRDKDKIGVMHLETLRKHLKSPKQPPNSD
jgi:hypothetical protein